MKIDYETLTDFALDLKLEFISGKFFNRQQEEVRNIDKYVQAVFFKQYRRFATPEQLRYIKDSIMYATNDKVDWYLPKVIRTVTEHYKKGDFNNLAFPLDKKQLQILHLLLFEPDAELMVITTGIGGSGKSTFLNIVRQLFENDFSASTLSDLSNEFIATEAVKHRLISSDELATKDLDSKILKTLISHQPFQANPKGCTPYTVQKTQSQLFFCCNKAPRIDIQDSGMLRRIVFYERNTKIENPDTTLNKKEYTFEELLNIARCAYDTPFNINDFKQETFKYITSTNPCCMWYARYRRTHEDRSYVSYTNYCYENGYKALNRQNFDSVLDWYDSQL